MSDPNKLKEVKRIGRQDIPFCLARVPDSGRIFFGSSDYKVYDANLADEKPNDTVKELAGHNSYVLGAALAGNKLVTGGYDRNLIWWDTEKHEKIRSVEQAHKRLIRGVVASPDEKRIASVADDMVCRIWDSESGTLLHELRGHLEETPHNYPSMLYACTFSPDGKLLATGDKVGHVVIWDIDKGTKVTSFESPENYTWDPKARRHSIGGIRSLQFSPDGKLLAVGGMGHVGNIDHLGGKSLVQVYDWNSGERKNEFQHDKRKGLVETLRFHHEGKWLLAGGGDNGGFFLFMDLNENKYIREEDAKSHIHDFALNENSDTIYAVGHSSLSVWEMKE
ncbi:MAG: WD40 repeat protein [Pirellulaceae bacterium]|jgi:WD40 repeat protein